VDDRRKFIRFPKKGLIKFREINLPKGLMREDESIYTNISAGGIMFEGTHHVDKGAVLKLEIDLRDWSKNIEDTGTRKFYDLPLKILGEVVHCEEIVPDHTYNIGIEFVGLDPKYQKGIIEYIKKSVK